MECVPAKILNEIASSQELKTDWARRLFQMNDQDKMIDQAQQYLALTRRGISHRVVANYQDLAPLMAENEAISRYVLEKNDPELRMLLPEICSPTEAMRIADNLRPMSEPERLQLATMLHDRKHLDAAKQVLANVPAHRRKAVEERALALHLQRRAGKGTSTYLAHLFKTPKAASTQSPDEIA
jgi:hypothetical protein